MDSAENAWTDLNAALAWRPIAEYDRPEGHVVLFRSGEQEAIGYWREGWWHAQESLDDQRLDFEPVEFAEVNDELRVDLMAD